MFSQWLKLTKEYRHYLIQTGNVRVIADLTESPNALTVRKRIAKAAKKSYGFRAGEHELRLSMS
jgi:hypothetical protein